MREDSDLVDLVWRRVEAAGGDGQGDGPGVELARMADGVAVRVSKDPRGPRLTFTSAEVTAFLDGAKSGEFDDLVQAAPADQK